MHLPVVPSHWRTVQSFEPVKNTLPLYGEMQVTMSLCPVRVLLHSPVQMSHKLIVLSCPQLTSVWGEESLAMCSMISVGSTPELRSGRILVLGSCFDII